MAIVNIKIDTEHLGDTPEVKIDGKKIDAIYSVAFVCTPSSSRGPLLLPYSELTIKRLSDHKRGHDDLDYLNDHVLQHLTWKTALH